MAESAFSVSIRARSSSWVVVVGRSCDTLVTPARSQARFLLRT